MLHKQRIVLAFAITALWMSAGAFAARDLPLKNIKLPKGFHIALYAENVPKARSMARGDKGTIFVGTRQAHDVYAVRDENGDNVTDKMWTIANNLDAPNGIVYYKGALYVLEVKRLLRFDDIENNLEHPPAPVVVYDQLPDKGGHTWKYLTLGPDEKFYFNIGSPGNIVNMEKEDPRFATISRINVDGTGFEVYEHGVRQSVGSAFHPVTHELWFTDNGRDGLGDDSPPDELNHATKAGQHFGYPFCHGGIVSDPQFGKEHACSEFTPPAQKLDAHVAVLGMKFYTGSMFPAEYKNVIFMAEHGSAERSIPIGYRIQTVRLDEKGNSLGCETFAEGWLQRTKAWGRPVDLFILPDGSMLVSDDAAGCLYRISYGQ